MAAGTYSVTVTDKNLCTLTDTLDIQLNSSSSEKAAQICIVSVDTGSKFNIIVWNKTGLARIDSFRIYFYNSSNQWQLIGAQPYAAPAYFADMTGINNPNSNTVRYSLTAVDSCGNEEPIGSSPWQNTCHINQSPPGTFTWAGTGYLKQGVSQPVFTYYLLRDSISNNHWVVVDSVSGTQNTMSDAVFQANPGNYPLARWRVSMVLSDSVNTGCKLPDEGPVHGVNNTTTRSNTQHNSIFTSVSALISAANSISVYPNPTNGKFTVQWSVVSGLSSVEVYNVLGEKVASFNSSKGGEFYSLPSGEEGWAIDLSNQPSGIYFVKVLTDKSVQVAKIIKE